MGKRVADMTPEQRERSREYNRRRRENMTPEQRERERDYYRRYHSSLTTEQRNRKREYSRRYDSATRDHRRSRERRRCADINAFAVVPPHTPWSPEENETVLSWQGTNVDLALRLGRTYASVGYRRRVLLDRLTDEA